MSSDEYRINNPTPGLLDDADVGTFVPEEWPKSASEWLVVSTNF